MEQVILLPCGNNQALQHYLETVAQPVELERVKSRVTPTEFAELNNIFTDGKAAIWGVSAGRDWKEAQNGAVALFSGRKSGHDSGGGDIFASGLVKYKVHSRELALSLWGTRASTDETWEYILFLRDIKTVNISYEAFNESIGTAQSNPHYAIQRSRLLSPEKSTKVIHLFGLKSGRQRSTVDHTSSVRILESVLNERNQIADKLGSSWPEFKKQTNEILKRLQESDEEGLRFWVDELLELGLKSDASDIYRNILGQVTVVQNQLRGSGQPQVRPQTELTHDADANAVYNIASALQSLTFSQAGESPIEASHSLNPHLEPRYLNAGFFFANNRQPYPTDKPLILNTGPYLLGVNVGRFWGPGKAGKPFPDDLLAPLFERQEVLQLAVVVGLPDGELAQATIDLPRIGDSHLAFFNLVMVRLGRQVIDIDLLYHGHLLQSRRLEVEVVERSEDLLQPSAWPVQDGYLTFTQTTKLDVSGLMPLQESPRKLTIIVERDRDYQRIGLRFYESSGRDYGMMQSNLTDSSLTSLLTAVRNQLVKTMNAYHGSIKGTTSVLEKHLGLWAEIGRHFYTALFPSGRYVGSAASGLFSQVNLAPGSIIQVAPLSPQVGVPWELLYDRRIESYREGHINLCPTFSTHKPAECPERDNPQIVCPSGFWGYRYIIEQLPGRLEPHATPPEVTLPMQIPNGMPLHFKAIIYTGFNQLKAHLSTLQDLAAKDRLNLTELKSLNDVRGELTKAESTADLLYFYTHGGSNTLGAPYIRIGAGEDITLIDLDAWEVNLERKQPLIILNACESADYSPESYENLVEFFCNRGAAGVVGTQCEVKELLANTFMIYFFRNFLKQNSAGQALYDARRTMLLEHSDPRGLVYSLFASAEVKLAIPILV